MRTVYSLKNIMTGLVGYCFAMALKFISRRVFIYTLGIEYLGVSGLFTNILSILSVSELGFGAAIVYSLYKPLAQNDTKKIQAIMNLYKRAYFYIGFVIALLGLLLLPFLPFIIKESTDLSGINVIYLLYLFQTVSSYWFFAYKGALLQADQRKYIADLLRYATTTVTVCIQIVFLFVYKSFILYLIIEIVFNILKNLWIAKKTNRLYPYIKGKNKEVLSKNDKSLIYRNVFGLSLYKISSTVLYSTDNIIISSFISIAAVGLYSNYLLITGAIVTLMNLFFSSFTASIGNLYVTESKEKSEFIFKCLNFLNFWMYGFSAICLWILLNPFITIWLGKAYILSNFIVLCIVLNFLTAGLQNAVILYKDACGLFWQGRYRPVASASLNIIISLILVQPMGIAGVLLGTIISRFLTTWWFDPWMVHKYAFKKSSKDYFCRYFRSLLITVLTAVLIQIICMPLAGDSWTNFIFKTIVCIVVPNILFFLLFKNSEEFKYIVAIIKPVASFFMQKLRQLLTKKQAC